MLEDYQIEILSLAKGQMFRHQWGNPKMAKIWKASCSSQAKCQEFSTDEVVSVDISEIFTVGDDIMVTQCIEAELLNRTVAQ